MAFSESLGLLLTAAIVGLLLLLSSWKKSFASLPPGPAPLPFVGNMLQVDVKELIKSLREVGEGQGYVFAVTCHGAASMGVCMCGS